MNHFAIKYKLIVRANQIAIMKKMSKSTQITLSLHFNAAKDILAAGLRRLEAGIPL